MRFVSLILTLTLFSIVACAAEQPPPTPLPRVKTSQSAKVARPVKTDALTSNVVADTRVKPTKKAKLAKTPQSPDALVSAPTEAATSVAASPPRMPPPIGALPKGAGQPPTRLVIPKMKLDTGVQEATLETSEQAGQAYTDFLVPYNAVGHLVTTVNPGELGNMVISGHHNLTAPNQFGKGLFGGLWDLQAGDTVYLFDGAGRAFAYAVSKSYYVKELGEPYAVRAEHGKEIFADTGDPVLTLITCWNGTAAPYSGNTYRWIVSAYLLNPVSPGQVPVIVPTP